MFSGAVSVRITAREEKGGPISAPSVPFERKSGSDQGDLEDPPRGHQSPLEGHEQRTRSLGEEKIGKGVCAATSVFPIH